MSLCINPGCAQPDHAANDGSQTCQSCGSSLLLLGRYRVMRLLSNKSGFGRVYEAFDRSTPKILKVLKEAYSQHTKAVELFRQEAAVLGQLPHPGIPAIEPQSYFEFQTQTGERLHCIIMEKIDGPNLKEWMQQQGYHPISQGQALNWLRQLTEILQLVHGKQYFHRDIKPENVMLRSNGQLVLVDFGAAREMTYSYLAQVGNTEGTRISSAGYTPPEQERGRAVPQSDFYALGYTLVYLLTGRAPTDGALYNSLENQSHWRQFAPQVSSGLANLIDSLIAPKASDRPQNTRAILQQLDQLEQIGKAQAGGLIETIAPRFGQAATTWAKSPGATTHGPAAAKPLAKLLQPWVWGGAIGLLVLSSYAVWQFQPGRWQREPAVVLRSLPSQPPNQGHVETVSSLAFTPDGQRLISGVQSGQITVWSIDTEQPLLSLTGHQSAVRSLAVKSDSSILVSASDDQTVKIWNLGIGQELRTLRGHTSYINEVVISPDGQLIASASADQTIKIWDLADGQELRSLKGHLSYVNAVAFSPDGRWLASASADQTVKLWEVATGTLLRTFTGHGSYVNAVAFSPDGSQIVSASADRTIRVWQVSTGETVRILTGHSSFVEALAISPDGTRLISGSADRSLKIWNLVNGQLLHNLTGLNAHIRHLVPSPDWDSAAVAVDESIQLVRLPE
ncbi:MAG: protein kinase domain-containing protein [Elainella sp.]